MSLSRGCLVVERHPNQWFCLVCHEEYEYNFEKGNHKVYGPAATEDGAMELMHAREANPGSFNTVANKDLTADDNKIIEFIDKRTPQEVSQFRSRFRF